MLSDIACRDEGKKLAVLDYIVANYTPNSKNGLRSYHQAFDQLFANKYSHISSFSRVIRICKERGCMQAFDKRLITKVQSRVNPYNKIWLQLLWASDKKLSFPQIHQKMTAVCKDQAIDCPSLSWVKLMGKQLYNDPNLYSSRYGEAMTAAQAPYASLLPAVHVNDQWQMDGWTLPFWISDKNTHFLRYVLYCIWDNHSKKILGYKLGETEDTALIIAAMDEAIYNTGIIAAEIVSDKHSFHKTIVASQLKEKTEQMGVIWTVTMNPQHNGIAERGHIALDALCKDYSGYTGKNITAKGKDSRPKPERMQQLAKPGQMRTLAEIKAIAASIVYTYNNTPQNTLEGKTPNQAYQNSSSVNTFPISEQKRISLLRPSNIYKVIRGQLTIKQGSKKHEFQLPAHLIHRYNNKQVMVYYEDLDEGIYIGEQDNGEIIAALSPKEKIHSAKVNQTARDIELLHKQAGKKKGYYTTKRTVTGSILYEAMKTDPDAAMLLAPYMIDKDIRKELLQNKELQLMLQQQGVQADHLPIRKKVSYLPAIVMETNTQIKKNSHSPFTDAYHTIKKFSPEDIYQPQAE